MTYSQSIVDQLIKKIEELAKNRVSEKVIEDAIRSEVNKKFKEIIRQL